MGESYPPLERAKDRMFVAGKNLQILELETQIAALAERISILQAEKLPFQTRLDSIRYPILTLPNEIVAEVFLHFIPPYPDFPPLTGLLSPMCLTQICHQWREIALTTPALWRAIMLPRSFLRKNGVKAASFMSLWLDRSRRCPLSICFDHENPLPILSTLLLHVARLEHLSFAISDATLLSAFDKPLAMPMLRSLDICFRFIPPTAFILRINSPCLTSAILSSAGGDPSVALPWSQLTSLTLKGTHPDVCMSILKQTSLLVECSLHLLNPKTGPHRFEALTLPYLERLVIQKHCERFENHTDFVLSLVAPALVSLQLPERILITPASSTIESLETFIAKSGCRLCRLTISRVEVVMDVTVYQLAFPSIPEIELLKAEWIRSRS